MEKREKKQINIALAPSQATVLETYDRRIATGATQKMTVMKRVHSFF